MTAMKEKPILFSAPMVRAILDGRKTQTRRIVDMDKLRVRLPRSVRSDNCGVPELDLVVKPIVARPETYRARLNRGGAVTLSDGRLGAGLGVKPGEFHFVCPYADGDTHLGQYGADDKRWTITPRNSRLWVKETAYIAPPRFGDMDLANCTDSDGQRRVVGYAAAMGGESVRCATDYGVKKSPSIFMPRWASRITLEVEGVRVERLQDITEDDACAEGVDAIPVGDVPRQASWSRRQDFANLWDGINGKRASWESNPWVWVVAFKRVMP